MKAAFFIFLICILSLEVGAQSLVPKAAKCSSADKEYDNFFVDLSNYNYDSTFEVHEYTMGIVSDYNITQIKMTYLGIPITAQPGVIYYKLFSGFNPPYNQDTKLILSNKGQGVYKYKQVSILLKCEISF